MIILKKLSNLLTVSEKKEAWLLLILILMMALIDMLGVASILPFVGVLANPDLIETNLILNKIYQKHLYLQYNLKFLSPFPYSIEIEIFVVLLFLIQLLFLTLFDLILSF